MNEIPHILEPKEKKLYDGKPLAAPYFISVVLRSILIGGLVGLFAGLFLKSVLVGIITGIIIFAAAIITGILAYSRIHYAITNKRIIFQSGIIGRDFKSIEYDRMQNVSVNVGLLGVIFKVGTIKIFTGEMESGGKQNRMRPKYDHFSYIPQPYEVLKQLQMYLSKRKEELA